MKRWFNIWSPWTNMLTWVTMSKVLCSGVFIYIKLLLRLFLKGTRIKNVDNVKNQITIIALVKDIVRNPWSLSLWLASPNLVINVGPTVLFPRMHDSMLYRMQFTRISFLWTRTYLLRASYIYVFKHLIPFHNFFYFAKSLPYIQRMVCN